MVSLGRFLTLIAFVLLSCRAQAEPLNIHVKFAWLDSRNCSGCTVAVLRLVVDGSRVFGSSVMLQDYDQLDNPRQRGVEMSAGGTWKCENHTQGRSAPDPRLWGVNFEVCLRLAGRSGSRLNVDYIMHIRQPNAQDSMIVETSFAVDVLGPTSCRATLLSARTTYADRPGVALPAAVIREQSCNFVAV